MSRLEGRGATRALADRALTVGTACAKARGGGMWGCLGNSRKAIMEAEGIRGRVAGDGDREVDLLWPCRTI